MPTYEVEDSQGRVIELEGDREPTQAEVEAAFSSAFSKTKETPSLQAALTPPGQSPLLASRGTMALPQAFDTEGAKQEAIAALPAIDPERVATTPFVNLPRPGAPGTVTRGLSELGAGAVEQALLTPASGLLAAATAIPGVRIAAGTLLTAAAAKGAAEKLGEGSVTRNPQTITEGVGMAALAGLGSLAVGADALPVAAESALGVTKAHAPASAEAVKATMESLGGKSLAATETPASPAGIVPEPVAKLAELQRGQELIDGDRIRVATREQDVMPGRDVIASPEFEFRNMPEAAALVTQGVEANLAYKSKVAHTTQQLEAFQKTLSKSDQAILTKALFAKEAGDAAAISNLPEPVRAAAASIRQTYDTIRERVIADKQQSIEGELSGPQLNALRQVQDGIPLEEAARTNGLRDPGKLIVESAKRELDELSTWGIEEYTTHIERGTYKVLDPEGTVIAKAETRPAAAIKADRYIKENPGTKFLTIDDSFNPGVEFPTKLSQGQYFRLVQRLKNNLGESADEIQRILHENGSIVAVKPTNKYAAPMQRRYGVLKGEENVFDVLPTYVHIMEKKLALDPVMRQARQVLPGLPENARSQIEAWLGDLKGNKSIGDKVADYLLAPYGLKPFAYSRSLEAVRTLSTHLKLGYRPVAAAVNRISGLQHTWTKTGTRYLLEGRQFIKTPEGQQLLEANKPYLGIEAAFVHERLRPSSEEPLYKPLGMFQAAERANRPEAFAAHYKYAQGELGLAGDEAAAYARQATRFGQFVYDMASLPRVMRNPTGRFLFQFKPYLVKELEFISSLRGEEIPRYLTGFLAVGGPRAALVTLKSLPVIGLFAGFDKLEDWLNQKVPAASRGLGGAMGVDVSPTVAFQFPQTASEFLGPVVSDLSKLYTDVIAPALRGEGRDWSDVQDWARKLAPALNYWSQLVESAASESGWITDNRGRMTYKPSKSDYVKLALGAKPLEKSIREIESKFLRDQDLIARRNRTRLIDDFLNAVDKKDSSQMQELLQAMAKTGVTVDAVKAAARNRKIEPQMRLLRSLSKPMRAQEIERFAPAPNPP